MNGRSESAMNSSPRKVRPVTPTNSVAAIGHANDQSPRHNSMSPVFCHGTNGEAQGTEFCCGVCHEGFDNDVRVPKILGCGHTFCLVCISSIARGLQVYCPMSCPYPTFLHESGVVGLTTNQMKLPPPGMPPLVAARDNSLDVCCTCFRSPPMSMCSLQKHCILPECDAMELLKPQFKKSVEHAVSSLRTVMALQATLKERMQYTLHSLSKFSEELTLKIEGEEMEEKMQQSLLVELNELTEYLTGSYDVKEFLDKFDKVDSTSHNIASKFSHCFAKDRVNGGLQSVLLELKDTSYSSCLNQLGFSRSEAFSLMSSLKDNADNGNFANVLLIYLLSDLLFTRYRPLNVSQPVELSPFESLEPSQGTIVEQEPISEESQMHNSASFDLTSMVEAVSAVEIQEEELDPIVGHDMSDSNNFITSQGEDFGFTIENNGSENSSHTPRSYLAALKKPAKPAEENSSNKPATKSVSPMKSVMKYSHCWMVLSFNGIRAGRVLFQLRPDMAPIMSDNFIALCCNRDGYGYKGTRFFKGGDGYLLGGDVENDDGTGGYSTFDKRKVEADLCSLRDDVGMVRFKGVGTSASGKGLIGSQFMIWYAEREFKKFSFSLVFAKVVDGMEVVKDAASCNLVRTVVKVEECGAI